MKKLAISIIGGMITVASTVTAIYYRKKYKKEVEAHWKTRYELADEAKRADAVEDEAWELKMIAEDFSQFMHHNKGDFAEWLKYRDIENGCYDGLTEWECDDYEQICKLAEEYYNKRYGKEADGS